MPTPRIAALGLLTAAAVLVPQLVSRGEEQEHVGDCQVVFQQKSFFDTGDFVYVAGTLTGQGIGYKYNTTAISCFKDRNECLVNSIESIGPPAMESVKYPALIFHSLTRSSSGRAPRSSPPCMPNAVVVEHT
jgi:hypothetical protein